MSHYGFSYIYMYIYVTLEKKHKSDGLGENEWTDKYAHIQNAEGKVC